ncbi:MAG: transcriptional regulator, partial [Streptococcus gallolyticus]|nr:transcriptional regulator [Streptococcus gallolyticus]
MIEDSQTQQLLEGELLENVSDFFKALGNGTRLQIIWCLSQGELK